MHKKYDPWGKNPGFCKSCTVFRKKTDLSRICSHLVPKDVIKMGYNGYVQSLRVNRLIDTKICARSKCPPSKRRQAQIEWEMKVVSMKCQKMMERTRKKDEAVAKLMGLTRIVDPNTVTDALVNATLDSPQTQLVPNLH